MKIKQIQKKRNNMKVTTKQHRVKPTMGGAPLRLLPFLVVGLLVATTQG